MATDHQYLEVSCQRDLTYGQFAAGLQDFVFSVGRPSVEHPSKSYMRFQVTVSGNTGADTKTNAVVQPTVQQQIALAEGCIANCYNNANFLAAAVQISAVPGSQINWSAQNVLWTPATELVGQRKSNFTFRLTNELGAATPTAGESWSFTLTIRYRK